MTSASLGHACTIMYRQSGSNLRIVGQTHSTLLGAVVFLFTKPNEEQSFAFFFLLNVWRDCTPFLNHQYKPKEILLQPPEVSHKHFD